MSSKSILGTVTGRLSNLFSRYQEPKRTSSNHRLPSEQQDQIMAAAAQKRARRAARGWR